MLIKCGRQRPPAAGGDTLTQKSRNGTAAPGAGHAHVAWTQQATAHTARSRSRAGPAAVHAHAKGRRAVILRKSGQVFSDPERQRPHRAPRRRRPGPRGRPPVCRPLAWRVGPPPVSPGPAGRAAHRHGSARAAPPRLPPRPPAPRPAPGGGAPTPARRTRAGEDRDATRHPTPGPRGPPPRGRKRGYYDTRKKHFTGSLRVCSLRDDFRTRVDHTHTDSHAVRA